MPMSNPYAVAEAFRKYHHGDNLTDDEIVEMMTFLEPIEHDGWVLDARFTFFVTEIREIVTRLRGFMNVRISNGRWRPTRDFERPKFLQENNHEQITGPGSRSTS